METKYLFLCIRQIYEFQCALITIKPNTLTYNLDELTLIYLLLDVWVYLVAIFKSPTLVSAYTPLYFKCHVL